MARGVGPTKNSNAVRNALRHCRQSPCECLGEAINRLVNGHDTGQGWNKGIMERIGNMLSPDANPPGTTFDGKDTWTTHAEQIAQRKNSLENLMEEYDSQGCGGGGGAVVVDLEAVDEALNAQIPTPEDYWDLYPDRQPSDGPGMLKRIGYGVGGTLLLIGAGALVLVPFDGPVGEVAAGAAGVGAWGLAVQ